MSAESEADPFPLLTDEGLRKLQADNAARLDGYVEDGNVVNITGPYVAALADFLLPDGDPRRREFAARWEWQLAEMLDELDDELAKAGRTAALTAPLEPNRAQRRHGRRA